MTVYADAHNFKTKRRLTTPMPHKRRPPRDRVVDEVMFRSDLRCCVCETRGHQIHHIDNDPSNNALDNLVFLCFEHHDEATRQRGLSRRLTPGVLRTFRDHLYRKVEAKRRLPQLTQDSIKAKGITEDNLFQLVRDAVSLIEINKIRLRRNLDSDEEAISAIYELSSYVESSGARARKGILEFLDDIASRTRFGMSHSVAEAVSRVAYDALPIRSLRFRTRTRISRVEAELTEYGLAIGVGLAYDGGLYVGDIRLVDSGCQLLWKILRFARMNSHKLLQQRALDSFDTAEDGATRGGDPDAVGLVKLYRQHGLSGDWRYPKYGARLLSRITARD